MSALLAIDGDSLAHRAYHGAARRPSAATRSRASRTWLAQLWQAEQPAAVLVGWDTLTVPTYRHEAFERISVRARVRRARSSSSSTCCRSVVRALGFVRRQGRRLRGGRLPRRRRATRGPARCASSTSDRDAYQLVSDRVTILQPTTGVTRAARASARPSVRERYGVEPEQVARPDRPARRSVRQAAGRARDRPEEGGGHPARSTARSRRRSPTGRFASEAEDLRLYRRIATMDASAPLPPLSDQTPTWAEASSFLRQLGLDARRRPASLPRVNEWLSQRADALAEATASTRERARALARGASSGCSTSPASPRTRAARERTHRSSVTSSGARDRRRGARASSTGSSDRRS